MRRLVSEVKEKWLFRRLAFFYKFNRIIRIGISRIIVRSRLSRFVIQRNGKFLIRAVRIRSEITGSTINQSKIMIEPTFNGPMLRSLAHMPFTGHKSIIARCFQRFCNRYTILIQVSLVSRLRPRVHHIAHTRLVLI